MTQPIKIGDTVEYRFTDERWERAVVTNITKHRIVIKLENQQKTRNTTSDQIRKVV